MGFWPIRLPAHEVTLFHPQPIADHAQRHQRNLVDLDPRQGANRRSKSAAGQTVCSHSGSPTDYSKRLCLELFVAVFVAELTVVGTTESGPGSCYQDKCLKEQARTDRPSKGHFVKHELFHLRLRP